MVRARDCGGGGELHGDRDERDGHRRAGAAQRQRDGEQGKRERQEREQQRGVRQSKSVRLAGIGGFRHRVEEERGRARQSRE